MIGDRGSGTNHSAPQPKRCRRSSRLRPDSIGTTADRAIRSATARRLFSVSVRVSPVFDQQLCAPCDFVVPAQVIFAVFSDHWSLNVQTPVPQKLADQRSSAAFWSGYRSSFDHRSCGEFGVATGRMERRAAPQALVLRTICS